MLNIFYQKQTLCDTLTISCGTNDVTNTKQINDDLIVGYHNDQIVMINFAHLSQYLQLPEGMLLPTVQINELINKYLKFDLFAYRTPTFVVGQVTSCETIPNTHLHKCKVKVGPDKVLDIICGAKNVKTDLKVVVALENAMLPNGVLIVPGKVCGFFSQGMLCSYKELNLPAKNEGIIELDSHSCIGDDFVLCYANH